MCAVLALNMIQEQEMTDSVPKCQLLKLRLPAVSSVTTTSWKRLMDKPSNITLSFYNISPMKLCTLFPVTRCCVIKDLNAVGLPGLNPASAQ